jgi:hypothetical protein
MGTGCENLPQVHSIIQAYNACARIAAPALLFKSEAIVHPNDVVKYISEGESPISYNPTFMASLWEAAATRDVSLLRYAMERRFALPWFTLRGVWGMPQSASDIITGIQKVKVEAQTLTARPAQLRKAFAPCQPKRRTRFHSRQHADQPSSHPVAPGDLLGPRILVGKALQILVRAPRILGQRLRMSLDRLRLSHCEAFEILQAQSPPLHELRQPPGVRKMAQRPLENDPLETRHDPGDLVSMPLQKILHGARSP